MTKASVAKKPDFYKEIYRKKAANRTPEARARYSRNVKQKRFGISFLDMVVEQHNRCDICKKPFSKTPCVDHDHVSGKARSLLCHECNSGLGMFKDSPTLLSAASEYLKKHGTKPPRKEWNTTTMLESPLLIQESQTIQ